MVLPPVFVNYIPIPTIKKEADHKAGFLKVVPPRIELGTQGFSVLCSTN